MVYQFEFVSTPVEKYGRINNEDKLCIWLNDGTDKTLLFTVKIEPQLARCAKMYHAIKNNVWENINCHVWSPDYGAHYYISTVVDGSKFITVSEFYVFSDEEKQVSFNLTLPWDKCDKVSFLEFLRQALLHTRQEIITDDDSRSTRHQEERKKDIEQCKTYDMYIPINTNIVNKILNKSKN